MTNSSLEAGVCDSGVVTFSSSSSLAVDALPGEDGREFCCELLLEAVWNGELDLDTAEIGDN